MGWWFFFKEWLATVFMHDKDVALDLSLSSFGTVAGSFYTI